MKQSRLMEKGRFLTRLKYKEMAEWRRISSWHCNTHAIYVDAVLFNEHILALHSSIRIEQWKGHCIQLPLHCHVPFSPDHNASSSLLWPLFWLLRLRVKRLWLPESAGIRNGRQSSISRGAGRHYHSLEYQKYGCFNAVGRNFWRRLRTFR